MSSSPPKVFKRSLSKISIDSAHNKSSINFNKNKITCLNFPSRNHSIIGSLIEDHYNKVSRNSILNISDIFKYDVIKAKQLEECLLKNFEEIPIGKSNWEKNLQIIDSIFEELQIYFKQFSHLFQMIRINIEKCVFAKASDRLHEKIEKVVTENKVLLIKINQLSKINLELTEENYKLKEIQEEYKRLINENPDFIVNYKNIVEKMLSQCQIISELNKKNKSLKDNEKIHLLKIKELENEKFH